MLFMRLLLIDSEEIEPNKSAEELVELKHRYYMSPSQISSA
jgi:hypothetical protein